MRYALHDIHRLYRNLHGKASAPLRVTHALGTVWFAGSDRVLAPQPAPVDTPWCQFGVVPYELTDGVEDRLVVCDAQLASNKLAWRVDAPGNEGNIFLMVARQLWLVARVDAVFPGLMVQIGGVLADPLGAAHFRARSVHIDGVRLNRAEAAHALAQLGMNTS